MIDINKLPGEGDLITWSPDTDLIWNDDLDDLDNLVKGCKSEMLRRLSLAKKQGNGETFLERCLTFKESIDYAIELVMQAQSRYSNDKRYSDGRTTTEYWEYEYWNILEEYSKLILEANVSHLKDVINLALNTL